MSGTECQQPLLECLLCGERIHEAGLIQKVGTSPRDLTVTLCTLLDVPVARFEDIFRMSSFCYKCVHRLIDAHLLSVKINMIGSKLQAVKVEVQSDLKRQLSAAEDTDYSNRKRLDCQELRKLLVKKMQPLSNGKSMANDIGIQTDTGIPLQAIVYNVVEPSEMNISNSGDQIDSEEMPEGVTENYAHSVDEDYDGSIRMKPVVVSEAEVGHEPKTETRRSLRLHSIKRLDIRTDSIKSKRPTGARASVPCSESSSERLRKAKAMSVEKHKELSLSSKQQRKLKLEKYNPKSDELKRKLTCPDPKCRTYFADEFGRQAHIKRIHKGVKHAYDCDVCGKAYQYPAFLRAHKLKHTGEDKFTCSYCGKVMRSLKSLKTHENGHAEGGKPFACEFCDSRYINRHHLESHRATHLGTRFPCDVPGCTKSYARERHLKVHQKIHEVPDKYKCDLCGKIFSNVYTLRGHQRDIHGNAPRKMRYFCKLGEGCNFASRIIAEYRRHQTEAHDVEKPVFQCELCGKRLSSKNTLQTHLRMHCGIRAFKCHMCDRMFSDHPNRLRHEKLHLADSKDHVCDICGKSFTVLEYLKSHLRTHLPKGHPDRRVQKPARPRFRADEGAEFGEDPSIPDFENEGEDDDAANIEVVEEVIICDLPDVE